MNKPCSMRPRHAGTIASAVAALFAASYAPAPFANPTGGQVVAGTVTIATPAAGQMNITQKSPNGIVNWNTFSIGSSEAVNISQPSASAALLNRVMGNDPSVIAGRLQANGKVFLVNPAGVIFAPGSSVNVGSMVASTLDISNADFLAGNFHFIGTSAASITNAGTLTAGTGGTIALLGGSVSNSGTVSARLGTVAMGAGGDITLDFAGDGLTTLKISQGAASALIGNTGTLAADGGMVVMSAQTADALAGTVINQQGIVRAQSIAERDGHILLDGGTSGVTMAGGTLDATGGAGSTGGRIDVTGYDVALAAGANLNASGAAGGGVVRFGGGSAGQDPTIRNANAVWMSPTAEIHADALASGNGGNVVAFGSTASRIYGTLTAKGGPQGGDGGLIETSGQYLDVAGAKIDASAPMGKGGTWVLDPSDIEICHGSDTGCGVDQILLEASVGSNDGSVPATPVAFGPNPPQEPTTITDQQISNSLDVNTSVQVKTTDGNITIDGSASTYGAAAIQKTIGGPSTLTLSALESIIFNAGASIKSTAAGGALNLLIDANVGNVPADNHISLLGSPGAPVDLFSNGGNITIGVKAAQPGTFDGAAVLLSYSDIDSRVSQSALQSSGAITIHGQAPGAIAVRGQSNLNAVGIFSSTIATSTGNLEVEGNQGSGTNNPVSGVQFSSAVVLEPGGTTPVAEQSSLSTGSGAIRIYGIGSDPTGTATYQVSGVAIDDSSTVQSSSGSIDVRGQLVGGRTLNSNFLIDEGVLITTGATLNAAGGGATVSIAGSTNGASAGVVLSSYLDGDAASGNPSITAGANGKVIIRASNNGSANSFEDFGTVLVQSNGGTLVLLPGVVNSDFSISNADATRINVNSDTGGFSINADALTLFDRFGAVVIGSSTQTGAITVYPSTTFYNDVTLEAGGTGSGGIALPSGAIALGYTLTLASAGPVTQGGAIRAEDLVLAGPGTYTLTNPANSIDYLSTAGTSTVNLVNSQTLGLVAANTIGFDSASGAIINLGPISGISVAGNLTVSTTTGDINVDTPIVSTARGPATLSLSAAGNVNVNPSNYDYDYYYDYFGNLTIGAAAGAGPLNMTLDANVGGTAANHAVSITNATIDTNGGTFTVGDTGQSAVTLSSSTVNTEAGNVTIGGTAQGNAISLSNTGLRTTTGNVKLTGVGSVGETNSGTGINVFQSSIQTTKGDIELDGSVVGAARTNSSGTGVSLVGGNEVPASISTVDGTITLNGTVGGTGAGAFTGGATGVTIAGTSAFGYFPATVKSTGSGAINITGNTHAAFGDGIDLSEGILSSSTGAITVKGTTSTSSSGRGVDLSGASINSDSGNVSITGTVVGATTFATGVQMQLGYFATNAVNQATSTPVISTDSGNIEVFGYTPATTQGSAALAANSATLTSVSGSIALSGSTTGTPASGLSSIGVLLENELGSSYAPTTITTGGKTLSVFGSGSGSQSQGVLMTDASKVISDNGGAINIRGVVTSPAGASGSNFSDDYGTLILNGSVSSTQAGSEISIAGSTNTSDAGLAFGAVPVPPNPTLYMGHSTMFTAGNVSVTGAPNGLLVLGAANDNTSRSLVSANATISAGGGTLAILPATVDPTTFAVSAQNATPITLYGTSGGMTIDAQTFATFSQIQTLALGSNTQTGLITINGVCASGGASCVLSKPNLNLNLTLSNPGLGSQGIKLPFGVSLAANDTLTLNSAGSVTDPGGIQATSLLLAGPGTFTLDDLQNKVGVLAMAGVGSVIFHNSGDVVIGPVTGQTYDASTNTMQKLDGTNSTLTGSLTAQSATGNLNLNSSLSGGTIDLVAENGVFTAAPSSTLTAGSGGWRIWANTWVGETRNNVQPSTVQPNFYGCIFAAGCSWGGTILSTGNHFVYVQRPTLTITADGKTRIAGAPNPTFTYTYSGLVNGDSAADAVTGGVTSAATKNSPAGVYAIDPNFASNVGYIVNEVPAPLDVVPIASPVAQSGLQTFFTSQEQSFVYENNLQGTNICVGVNQPLFTETPPGDNQDLLAVEWKRVRSQPNLNSCMTTNSPHGCSDF